MRLKPRELTWLVEDCVPRSVVIRAVTEDAEEERCHARFRLAPLGEPGAVNDDWEFTLDWTEDPPLEDLGPWRVRGSLRPVESSLQVAALTVEPTAEGQELPPLTGHVLRSVPLGLIHDAVYVLSVAQVMYADLLDPERGQLGVEDLKMGAAHIIDFGRRLVGEEYKMAVNHLAQTGVRRLTRERPMIDGQVPFGFVGPNGKGPGRPKRSPEDLMRFAQDFLAVQGSYASLCAKREMNENTAKGWVAACRQAGWLAPGQSGRSGVAAPGPLLIEAERMASN